MDSEMGKWLKQSGWLQCGGGITDSGFKKISDQQPMQQWINEIAAFICGILVGFLICLLLIKIIS